MKTAKRPVRHNDAAAGALLKQARRIGQHAREPEIGDGAARLVHAAGLFALAAAVDRIVWGIETAFAAEEAQRRDQMTAETKAAARAAVT